MKLARKIGAVTAVTMMMSAAIPARAASPCWGDREVSAARVREMQTVLMVAALRCRAAGIDISADYNGFVTAQRGALAVANLVIKEHFAANGGSQSDYDRFATSLANGHGDDETTDATCAEASALAHDGAAAVADGLLQLATLRVFPVALPGGSCAAPAMTSNAPSTGTEALPPIVMAMAPPAPRAPVTLAPDVVAALTVLARYQSAPPAPAKATLQVAAVAP